MRRRSTHLFSQRSPGDVGQDEQDSVSCRKCETQFEKELFNTFNTSRVLLLLQVHRQGRAREAESPSRDKDRASASSDSYTETTFWHFCIDGQ